MRAGNREAGGVSPGPVSRHVHAAVDVQCLAGDVRRRRTDEKRDGLRDVVGFAEASQGDLLGQCGLRDRQNEEPLAMDQTLRMQLRK